MTSLKGLLESLGADLGRALEALNLGVYLVDVTGRIRWQNAAAVELIGPRTGSHFLSVLAPEYQHEGRSAFSRKLLGSEGSVDREWIIVGPGGSRTRVITSGVPLESGRQIVGVLGIARVVATEQPSRPWPKLTPRQHELLRLLGRGLSTTQIAAETGIASDTARGHLRRLFAALEVHSRIEAVARGRELGLI